jgi:hypothetical protein
MRHINQFINFSNLMPVLPFRLTVLKETLLCINLFIALYIYIYIYIYVKWKLGGVYS